MLFCRASYAAGVCCPLWDCQSDGWRIDKTEANRRFEETNVVPWWCWKTVSWMDILREQGVSIKSGNDPESVLWQSSFCSTVSLCSVRQKSRRGSRSSARLRHVIRPASALPPLGSCEERFTRGLATVAMVTEALPSNTCVVLWYLGERAQMSDVHWLTEWERQRGKELETKSATSGFITSSLERHTWML